MNIENNYQQALENARLAMEAAREKAESLKITVEKETTEAEQANADAKTINENAKEQQNIYLSANSKIALKQSELDNAYARLNSLSEEDIETAELIKEEIRILENELQEIKAEAQKEYEELLKLQQDAQTALTRAEIEKKEADESLKELAIAEEELAKAETEFKEAERIAAEEELKLAKEPEQLTEEQALKEGYTIIKTADDLQAISQNLSGKYILMNDIDLSGVEWKPIGNLNPTENDPWAGAFSGIFNGNGYSIRNLTVVADEDDTAIGLFGATNNATITNTQLKHVNIDGGTEYNEIAVGGLIGISRDTDIDNVSVTGDITGYQGVGGLVGVIDDTQNFGKTEITNVNTLVDVNSEFYAGGLIGKINSTYQNSLMIDNCHTSGDITVTDSSAGGLIGEAGQTLITITNSSSDANVSRVSNLPSELSWLLDTSKVGGIIGNCNGTYISICNTEFNGTLNSDDEFKGEHYGWYMNDAQVSIFELSAGLPVNDILNIEGIEDIVPIIDPETGVTHYEVSVSTLAGMNRIVDMVQNDPVLADLITYNVQFDFETMDAEYGTSIYNQYGVVQHLYEDENGNTVNDVYIDNEIDLESTFNNVVVEVEVTQAKLLLPTMIKGLYKDNEGKYFIFTGAKGGKYEGYSEISLSFYYNNFANVKTRLNKDEVRLREELVLAAYTYQNRIQETLAKKYGYEVKDLVNFLIKEPEYKALKKKEALGQSLTKDEKLKIELFELNYKIMNIIAEITNNKGCGMGGNASFLDNTKTVPLKDENGQLRYMTTSGLELRQKVDENGEPILDENGNILFVTLDGEDYDGSEGVPYIVTGLPISNEEGNLLYSDADGNTVIQIKNEDGTYKYIYEDGTEYEGNSEDLKQQLKENSPVDMFKKLDEKLSKLEETYNN